jgi:hypothetical protein
MRRATLRLSPVVLLLVSGCGTDVAGPSASLFSCLFTEPRAMGVGEVALFDGSGNRSLCLRASEDGATFVYVPFHASAPPGGDDPIRPVGVRVLGGGVVPAGGVAASPAPGGLAFDDAGSLRLDHSHHRRIREREIAELGPLLGPPPSRSPEPAPRQPSPVMPLPAVGEVMEINVALSCSAADPRRGLVVAVSDQAIVLAEEAFASRFSAGAYASFAASFDTLVYPMATRVFGEPSDVDGNGRILIFFTSMVNGINPRGSASITAGVFWAGDLFPATETARLQACPAGNQAEVFYLAVPDPGGALGPAVPASWIADRVVQVMGHEYQHLLNAARRMYVTEAAVFEQVWLNEGLSHIAEELLFYEATGLPPGANITWSMIQETPGGGAAYERYMGGNHMNLRRYLQRPDTVSPMGPDGLATRGATWSFLRYAADRAGGGGESVFFGLVNSTRAGLENLDQVLPGQALRWMQDWTVALYANPGAAGLDPRYAFPSWNLRDIHRVPGGGYFLRTEALGPGAPHNLSLLPGGAGFLAFGIGPGGSAAIHVEADGSTPRSTLRGAFLRVR